jgi:uncharacterized glyoxalase superfamily metalloenzyme YdcJ
MTNRVPAWQLRAEFARGLARMYGGEVPAYTTLVEVSRAVNEDVAAARGAEAERLGSIERVTAERHGAVRVGSPRELAQIARIFAAFGMHPVGCYDLRDASGSSVPVVSTAFRPIDPVELAKNPFRVFTSMLTTEDRRFFDPQTQHRLEAFIASRRLFGNDLLELADQAAAEGLDEDDAAELLRLATAAFELSDEPVDQPWYEHLERISSVAADIGGVPTTHINHLTPRVLDIDELYARMQARGITMIDDIQGPPAWEGPDILLRQTSFRALAEGRTFRMPDGSVQAGELKVRFGEVEQRAIALTPRGRDLYDRLVVEVDRRRSQPAENRSRAQVAQQVWREHLPNPELGLALEGLAFFTYQVARTAAVEPGKTVTLTSLVESGALLPAPIVYEDFLPRSAAGIFQSNLTDEGTRDDQQAGAVWDAARLSDAIGNQIQDPMALYAAQQEASLTAAEHALGVRIDREDLHRHQATGPRTAVRA